MIILNTIIGNTNDWIFIWTVGFSLNSRMMELLSAFKRTTFSAAELCSIVCNRVTWPEEFCFQTVGEKIQNGAHVTKLFNLITLLTVESRCSTFGIATDYGLHDRGLSSSPGKVKDFHIYKSFRLVLGLNQPSEQWIPGHLSRG